MDIKVTGDKLSIEAILSKGTPSKTGKTLILASTGGFVAVQGADNIKVSINVIKTR